jgi:hypothetical protein
VHHDDSPIILAITGGLGEINAIMVNDTAQLDRRTKNQSQTRDFASFIASFKNKGA